MLNFPSTLPGTDAAAALERLEDRLAVSGGSACHAGAAKRPSPVLLAMGLSEEDATASLRISIGKDNTEDEIEAAVKMIKEAL